MWYINQASISIQDMPYNQNDSIYMVSIFRSIYK